MRTATVGATMAACVLTAVLWAADGSSTRGADAPAVDDRDASILKAAGVGPDAQGVMEYLGRFRSSPETTKMAADLVKQLGDADWKTREAATEKLRQIAVAAVKPLEEAANSGDEEVKRRAKDILDNVGGAPAIGAALRTAGRLKPPGAVKVMLEAVPNLFEDHLVTAAREAIISAAGDDDMPVLRAALKSDEAGVRKVAVGVLGKLLGGKAADDVAPLLADADDAVAMAAARVLADAADNRSLPALGRLLSSANVNVRAESIAVLEAATGRKFGFIAYEPAESRQKAADAALAWINAEGKTAKLIAPLRMTVVPLGRTLICLPGDVNKVVELDAAGKVTFELKDLDGPWGCQGLPDGRRLITCAGAGAVIEYGADGKEIWRHEGLAAPQSVQRLPSGNTLVGCGGGKVLEIRPDGGVAWKVVYNQGVTCATRLDSGNTLIVIQTAGKVFEIDANGSEVWKIEDLKVVRWAQRLANDNTLAAITGDGRVAEFTRDGKEVWSSKGWASPKCAQRLPNGNTLITDQNGVFEVDKDGKKVWEHAAGYTAVACRY
ncbi:MAG: hypothetical protein ACE15C_16570 [Phycisphaerae bacterium]